MLRSVTVIWVNTVYQALNMDIPSLILIIWLYGRHSLAISLTEPPRLSIIIWFLVKANGEFNLDWSSIYLMEWMDKVLNIARVDWKDFCNSAMTTPILINLFLTKSNYKDVTCRLLHVQTHQTSSMFWEDSLEEILESLLSTLTLKNCLNSKE